MSVKDLLGHFRRRFAAKNDPINAATFEVVELNDYVDWIRGYIVEYKLPDESMALVEGLLFLEIHDLRRLRFPSRWRIVGRGSTSADGRVPAPWVNRCANEPMVVNSFCACARIV